MLSDNCYCLFSLLEHLYSFLNIVTFHVFYEYSSEEKKKDDCEKCTSNAIPDNKVSHLISISINSVNKPFGYLLIRMYNSVAF
jgi:hypothetical protein